MIEACMECASRELRWPSASDGALLGSAANLNERVCQRGHRGVPLRFDDEASWEAFLETRRNPRSDADGPAAS